MTGLPVDALAVVIAYLEQQYLPPPVKDALIVLTRTARWDLVDFGLGPAMHEMPGGRFLKVKAE